LLQSTALQPFQIKNVLIRSTAKFERFLLWNIIVSPIHLDWMTLQVLYQDVRTSHCNALYGLHLDLLIWIIKCVMIPSPPKLFKNLIVTGHDWYVYGYVIWLCILKFKREETLSFQLVFFIMKFLTLNWVIYNIIILQHVTSTFHIIQNTYLAYNTIASGHQLQHFSIMEARVVGPAINLYDQTAEFPGFFNRSGNYTKYNRTNRIRRKV